MPLTSQWAVIHKTTHPITKLYPLEVSNLDKMNSDDTTECVQDPQPTTDEPNAKSDPLAATVYIERLPPRHYIIS